jgi:hypothetical protein
MDNENTPDWKLDHDMTRINVIDDAGRVIATVPRQGRTYEDALSLAMRIAALPTLTRAVVAGHEAVDAVISDMTWGERFTSAGQGVIDALPVLRDAIVKARA